MDLTQVYQHRFIFLIHETGQQNCDVPSPKLFAESTIELNRFLI
jgi:hypothetical protein